MRVIEIQPPRVFSVGRSGVTLSHCADIVLRDDEIVTFATRADRQFDVARKSWGYYATPSLAGRLVANGLRAALARNIDTRHCFIVLIEVDSEDTWRDYCVIERMEIVLWLDDREALSELEAIEPWEGP